VFRFPFQNSSLGTVAARKIQFPIILFLLTELEHEPKVSVDASRVHSGRVLFGEGIFGIGVLVDILPVNPDFSSHLFHFFSVFQSHRFIMELS
jgi:hypothetical protein